MSYEPTEWKSGDVITSTKLNKIENGIQAAASGGGGALIVGDNVDGTGLNKTWKEINDALQTMPVYYVYSVEGTEISSCPVISTTQSDGSYVVYIAGYMISGNHITMDAWKLETDSENGYPVYNN